MGAVPDGSPLLKVGFWLEYSVEALSVIPEDGWMDVQVCMY